MAKAKDSSKQEADSNKQNVKSKKVSNFTDRHPEPLENTRGKQIAGPVSNDQSEMSPEDILKADKKARKERAEEPVDKPESAEKPAKADKTVKKTPVKPPRTKLERRSKKYREAHKLIDHSKSYLLAEAIVLAQKSSYAKFDAAIELHVNLGVDPKLADQMVRGTISLPHGTGKTQRVAVFASDTQAKAAKAAGADIVGEKTLLADIEKGKLDFDILVTTPDMMAALGKQAKILGPKGLMPNPKSGTVTTDLAKTVKELKTGRLEFRVDGAGIIHQVVGKVSFKPDQIAQNITVFLKAIQQARPASVKATYIEKATLAATMGPPVQLDLSQVLKSA